MKHSEEIRMYQYMTKDQKIECDMECEQKPNTMSCKLKIFNCNCPAKSLKENYYTGCYEVEDKEEK